MHLYLVRHGIAEDVSDAKPDRDRRLTSEGKAKMRRAAEGLRALGVRLDLVLTSPLRRAEETAAIVAEALGGVELQRLEALASGAAPRAVLAALAPFRRLEAIALVGHEPDLGNLASFLLTGSPSACPLPFKKGAVACVETDGVAAGDRGHLLWFATPRQLRAAAGAGPG